MEVLLPVVSKNGPEKGQGVFRNVTVDPFGWDPMAYIVPLGYLASIWQKVCFPSYPNEVGNRKAVSGEGFYDFTDVDKNFLCSAAMIELVEVPAGVDMRFGQTPNVYAGQCAFFTSSDAKHESDWGLITPLRTTATLQVNVGIASKPPGVPVPPPQEYAFLPGGFSGVVKVPYTGLVGNAEVNEQPQANFTSTFVFAVKAKQPKAAIELAGGVENTRRAFFPLQYINWQTSMFFPNNTIANGFWWHLKPGVVANIRIFGTLVEPGIEASGGEFGTAKFNPMKGEELE